VVVAGPLSRSNASILTCSYQAVEKAGIIVLKVHEEDLFVANSRGQDVPLLLMVNFFKPHRRGWEANRESVLIPYRAALGEALQHSRLPVGHLRRLVAELRCNARFFLRKDWPKLCEVGVPLEAIIDEPNGRLH